MMEKKSYKYYNKRITTPDNCNVHDPEESKSSSTINENSGAHTLHDEMIIKKVHSIRIMLQLLKQLKL